MITRDEPIIIASLAREQGITGVHTHVHQLCDFLARSDGDVTQVTPHSWAGRSLVRRLILGPLFGVRLVLERVCGPAHVWWYRTSHEWFLRLRVAASSRRPRALRGLRPVPALGARRLEGAQGPINEWCWLSTSASPSPTSGRTRATSLAEAALYRSIREFERRTVPAVDGLVFVSSWARSALHEWMPEAARVPGVVIPNFVRAVPEPAVAPRADLVSVGNLEAIKNHRYLLRVLAAARQRGRPLHARRVR